MNNDEKKWEILHSEYLIRRPWLTADATTYACPMVLKTQNTMYWNTLTG